MAAGLLASRRFLPLFATQLLAAINDNLFKNALVVLVLYRAGRNGGVIVALAGGVFILPYVLFSAPAGQLADRCEKARLVRLVKLWELGLMGLAGVGFLADSVVLLMAVLFGLGVQATFFGPVKYALLPSHLAPEELLEGNGLIEAGTFIGILAGTIAGGALILLPHGRMVVAAAGLAVAVGGIASAWAIPPAAAAAPGLRVRWNVPRETARLLREARENRPVWAAILGISWFWTVGATVLAEFPTLARDALHAGGGVVTLMLACFSVGVGIGSLGSGWLLRGEGMLRAVPLAALGISVFTWDFARAATHAGTLADVAAVLGQPAGWRLLADLLLLALCGGVYSVPLYVVLQQRAAVSHRARMVACNNVVNAAAMATAAVGSAAAYAAGATAASILLVAAGANLLVAGLWWWRLRGGAAMAPIGGDAR